MADRNARIRSKPADLFNAARRTTDPAARNKYLDKACGDDIALRRQVDALLAAHEQSGSFLGAPAIEMAGLTELKLNATAEQPTRLGGELSGTTIGRYRLLERIGEGGFGVVYLAEQQHPVRRKVALKVVKPGLDTRQVIVRFEAERQALALMDHENIARVLDAGATDAGRPYFVMELVHGVPITEYCDQNQLDPRQRLELFVMVCRAVQHAHTKGIIHRDIKPTNVLVTVHDGVAVPKVIDFGIAKATGQQLTDKTLFTNVAQMIGTPLYMSPEQAAMTGNDIDTRSDIYSLGVLLYELLTGLTPFDKERFRQAAYDEVRRMIQEEEPPRPSTRLSESRNLLPSISVQRHTDPAKLTKLVHGELDWIVMKALEKDRNRRYETANGLARDIERYLNDERVEACPPSARYRLRKFTRRYRVPLAVAAGFLLLLVAGAVISTWQAIRIRAEQQNTVAQKLEADKERKRAESERAAALAAEQKALTEARKSEHVAAFMTDMLRGVGPGVALGRDTTMLREILEATAKRLGELKRQPAVEADLRAVLGGVYLDLADYPQAEKMFRAALELRRATLGPKHMEVARALADLGESLSKLGDSAQAERLLTESLAMQRELLHDAHPLTGFTLYRLGMVHNRAGNGAKAEKILCDSLDIYRRIPGQNIAGPLDQLASSLVKQGKHAEAEPLARESLEMRRQQAPAGSPGLAAALYNFAALLRDQGKITEAEPFYRESLEIRLKQLPAGHPDTLWSMNALASALFALDRGDEAVGLVAEFMPLAEGKARFEDQIRGLRRSRGIWLSMLGRTREAVDDFEKLSELAPDDFWAWYEVATLYQHVGDSSRYRIACREMLDRFEKPAASDPKMAAAMAKICALAPDAVTDTSRVDRLSDLGVTGTENHQYYRWFLLSKGLTEYRAGRHTQALEWLQRFRPSVAGTNYDGSCFATIAMARHRLGQAAEARSAVAAAQALCAQKSQSALNGWAWRDWLHCEILLREAEALIGAVSPQEAAAERERMLDRELAELSQKVELEPRDSKPVQARALFLIGVGRFRDAARDLDKVTELSPSHQLNWSGAAAMHVWNGDAERYQEVCAKMLDRFAKLAEERPEVAERMAKTCALAPGSVPDFSRVERLAERCVAGTEAHNYRHWFVLTKGLTEYRAGRHKQAVVWLGRFAPQRRGTHSDAAGFAVLAMAQHQLRSDDEARASLAAARDLLSKRPPYARIAGDWRDWLHSEILYREAEMLLSR